MKLASLLPAAAGTAAVGSSISPLLIASLGASAVGGLLQSFEQSRARRKRDDDMAAIDAEERVRQQRLARESDAALARLTRQHGKDGRPQAVERKAESLVDAIVPEAISATPALPGGDRTSQTIREDAAARMSAASAEVRNRLSALAGLQAFDFVDQDVADAYQRDSSNESVRNNRRAGGLQSQADANRYIQAEYDAFQPSALSTILSGAGQLGSMAAGAGYNFPTGSSFPPEVKPPQRL